MINQQEKESFIIKTLMAKNALLEQRLADKNSTIAVRDSAILDKDSAISKLTTDLEAAKFQNDQLRRMIFGAKRERFVSQIDINQLCIEFEPKAVEIEEAVKAERELIRVAYERKKPKKEHPGRLALPSHLPVVEAIIEPSEDTTDMVCIGREITEELDYTPAKLHINRIIRPKYITKEDEKGNQKQVIAELDRPIPKCIASPALLSMIFTDKFIFHLPLYRILKRIIQLGVPLPSSTLESWVKLGAQLLQPLYAVHRLHVFREIYQMVDESPIKVQDKDKKRCMPSGIHVGKICPIVKICTFRIL